LILQRKVIEMIDPEMVGVCIAAFGVPSAVTAFCFWLLEQRLKKRDDEQAKERKKEEEAATKREQAREKNELFLVKAVGASLALGEATAKAVQRIPDAHCNGDMHAALNYAQKVKHEQKDFLSEQAITGLY
jgi:hypothetical protein